MAWYAKLDGFEGGSTNTMRDPDRIVFNETEARGDGVGGTLIADDILLTNTSASAEGGDGGVQDDLGDILFDIVDSAAETQAGGDDDGGGGSGDISDFLFDIVDSAAEARASDDDGRGGGSGDLSDLLFDIVDSATETQAGGDDDGGDDGTTDIPDCIIWNIDGAGVLRNGDDDVHDRQAAGGHDELVIFGGNGEIMYAVAETVPDYSEFDFVI